MRYKNVSNSHLRLNEYKFLGPSKVIDLDEDDLKNPEIKAMIKYLGWLVPDVEEAPIVAPIKSAVIKSKKVVKEPSEDVKQKAIDEAIKRAAGNKKQWNPMDDVAPEGEPDFVNPITIIDHSKHYGNMELQNDANNNPLTHMGGTENDKADTFNMGQVDYIPHHPEDLVKYNVSVPEVKIVKARKKKSS